MLATFYPAASLATWYILQALPHSRQDPQTPPPRKTSDVGKRRKVQWAPSSADYVSHFELCDAFCSVIVQVLHYTSLAHVD